MEESSYKHNYEYLSIEEAKAIINGTFVQGTTNIGGELATKADIDKLLTAADKKLASIVPVTDTSNEFICFFECVSNETFLDDEAHRWIEITPTDAGNFTEAGGTITVTGSYGLTGSYGTRKTVGQINDTITVERNTTTQVKSGSKTYYYNNATGTSPSATVTWTQDAHIESFTYEYHIYVGQNANTIQQKFMQFIWQSDQYNQSSKKTVFVKAYKNKINEHNQIVSTDSVEYGIKDEVLNNQFTITDNKNGQIYCYPLKENSSYSDSNTGSFIVYIKESENVECKINFIQDRKGVQVIYGDAVMFTYNWNEGLDLDQATFVNLNLKTDKYCNYAGFAGHIIDEYKNILYFAGDNVGTGNEYSFIDFKNVSKYLNKHKDDQSSIAGKTIIQSLTDNNGVIKIQCELYTNWYRPKKTENITLLYSVYNKDSEDATVTASNNKQFILTGYTKIKDSSDQALCYASGRQINDDNTNAKDIYTLSAKFSYYLDSGVFVFDTNKNNVGKWHKGVVQSSEVIADMDFGESNTVEIIPKLLFDGGANNYTEEKYTKINPIELEQNVLTIQKHSA